MGAALHIEDSEFEQKILKGDGTFLVDFWAEWCGPCRQIAPVLDEIAAERGGKITVVKVNIDKNPSTPQKYGVRGIPTLIIFKNGQAVSTKVGSLPKSKLVEWIDSVVA
jgi:thioredoxin 1